jgi:hypothetical protein
VRAHKPFTHLPFSGLSTETHARMASKCDATDDFQLLERTARPMLRGALADDYAVWGAPPPPPERPVGGPRVGDRKLPVVSA